MIAESHDPYFDELDLASTKNIPSSCESSALQLQGLLCKSREVHLLMPIFWHVFARGNAVDGHLRVELEAAEELGSD